MLKILFSIGAIQVLLIVVGMVRAKAMSLLLGPAGFGIVSTIDQVVMSVVQLVGLSLPFTALKFLSRSHSESPERFQTAYSSFLKGIALLALIGVVGVSLLLRVKPAIFGADLVPYRDILTIAVLTVPAYMASVFFIHTLAAAQRPTLSAMLGLLVTLCLSAAAVIGVALGDIRTLYLATATTGVFTTVATVYFVGWRLRLRVKDPAGGILQELRRSPEVVAVSFMLYAVLSAYSISMLITRYFVFSRLGEAEAGLLQALLGIALALGAVIGPMNTLYLAPLVNRTMPARPKLEAAHDFQEKLVILLAVIVLPVLLFPRLCLTVLFSSAFTGAAEALFLFVLWQVVYQLVNVYGQLLIGLDDVRFFAITNVIGFAIVAAAAPFLIPRWGLMGAASALTTATLFVGLTTAIRLKAKYSSGIPPRVLRLLLGCLGSIVFSGLVFARLEEWSVAGIVYRLLYAGGFLAATWHTLLPEQRDFFMRLGRRRV
ncbi:MAG: polysaccharide biosynthesis C-terminal domain-containing protein [bacterium]|nr:polysaccharide biosynthesis C-terminal domain-containing protein [bacterium]